MGLSSNKKWKQYELRVNIGISKRVIVSAPNSKKAIELAFEKQFDEEYEDGPEEVLDIMEGPHVVGEEP